MAHVIFLGIRTSGSAIEDLFPAWRELVGFRGGIRLIDLPRDVEPAALRRFLKGVRQDDRCRAVFVTGHKGALYEAAGSLLARRERECELLRQVGAIYKTGGVAGCHAGARSLAGDAPDVRTTRSVAGTLFHDTRWLEGSRAAVILGAGGAGRALAYALARDARILDVRELIVTDVDAENLARVKRIEPYSTLDSEITQILAADASQNDKVIRNARPGALVVNATGLGKDAAGSPVSERCTFPDRSIAWDFNYRGTLPFLDQAVRQRRERDLLVEDGFRYFVAGWANMLAPLGSRQVTERLTSDFMQCAVSCPRFLDRAEQEPPPAATYRPKEALG